ncbi:MAG: D-glucuronyl C5-epimerase family protein [Oscillospiraceae bacterium]|jgi:hypothetical protein|nr:D-glucuronyl C5-epimerase family protein [Oscillospiraceae bacterium]
MAKGTVTGNLRPNFKLIYDELSKKKLFPKSKGDKRFVICTAPGRMRQTTVFGYDENVMSKAFDDALDLISQRFGKRTPEWFFGGVVTKEEKILITDFCKKVQDGSLDWDGISFDGIFNFALLKQDILGFELIDRQGKINDIGLTQLFWKKRIIDTDLSFTSTALKYITVFKIAGFGLYDGEFYPYNSSDISAELPYSLLTLTVSDEKRLEHFENKLGKLTKKIKSNNVLTDRLKNLPQQTFIISISDAKERAMTFTGAASGLDKALRIAKEKTVKYIKNYAFNPIWVKLDAVIETETKSFYSFKKELCGKREGYKKTGNPGAFFYDKGISLDDNFEFSFLSQELNTEGVWDYDNKIFDFTKANLEFAKRGLPILTEEPSDVIVFQSLGYMSDEKDDIFRLIINKPNEDYYGRRDTKALTKDDISEMVKKSVEFLLSTQKADGSFIYGVFPSTGRILTSYNIVRHIATSTAMLQYYDITGRTDPVEANSCNEYALDCIVYKDINTAFVYDQVPKELKLGASAVMVINLATYSDFFPTKKYNEYIRVLANGILELQEDDGSFYHVLNRDFSRKERNRIVYYDGEAVYSLIRAYDTLGDKKYLDAAEKSVNYFIANHYEQYIDHWVAYSMNHITRLLPKQEYFNFGLLNATSNLRQIYERRTPYHTYLELLTQTFTLSNRLEELIAGGNSDLYIPSSFSKKELSKTILHRIDYMANSYLYPEFAMYMNDPQRCAYTFTVRHWNWRIRIDDLAHFIGAYYEFLKRYDDIIAASRKNVIE